METNGRHIVRVYVGALSQDYEALSVEASKHTTASEIIQCIIQRLGFTNPNNYELAEVIGNSIGQDCKERRLGPFESPVALKLLWPKDFGTDALLTNVSTSVSSPFPSKSQNAQSPSQTSSMNGGTDRSNGSVSGSGDEYRFCLREKLLSDSLWSENITMDPQIMKDYLYRFLYQPNDKEYPDLCQLSELNEATLLENLKSRFSGGHIYTYVGSILIAVNPFKFHPIYNPKYVKLYQNRRHEELPPHIFSIADSAYHAMLKERRNQCIVISGESGSGKTESTNFLLHHLTALSQKGTHGSGVEQTILSAGPVLEAFGNAKTAHNNNSSRFGKFIQVSYRENGMVLGAIVQKYLLEKSRICCQAKNERNYHVFYYLLAGASETERELLNLLQPHKYHYLNQSGCYTLEGVDESYEFSRLKQSMEMVGFGPDKQKKLFCVLSAVLLLGNVEFQPKKSSYHHDESVLIKNPEVVKKISSLLSVTQETLTAALTSKRARVSGEMLVINYRMPEAIAARDAMAKCLYGALFDWIVLQVNHALLSKKDSTGSDVTGNSIGVLDIFGFEDFGNCNSFEQFCINYANEHLQQYFNQHVFKYEQEEYKRERIRWTNIGFSDNTPCLNLIEAKPNGIICILDDQCNFPGATNETLLQKFNSVLKDHEFYETPQRKEGAFIVRHYAGKVKYQVLEFREKNMDLMRHDIVSVVKNSSLAFVRELVGIDPVAVFRWAILRAFFRALFAFHEAGRRQRLAKAKSLNRAFSSPGRRRSSNNDHLLNNEIRQMESNHVDIENGSVHDNKYNYSKYKLLVRRSGHHNGQHHHRPYPTMNNTHYHNNLNNSQTRSNGLCKNPPEMSMSFEPCDTCNFNDAPYVNGHNNSTTSNSACFRNNVTQSTSHSIDPQPIKEYDPCECCYMTPNCGGSCLYYSSSLASPSAAPTINIKNRSFRLQPLVSARMKNLASVKTLASQTAAMGVSNKFYNSRKQPISVSQQFQQSLHSLMITLNQANPFFIRCIKSNSDKSPNHFDDEIVQRQLRYTGMLETVRIRQAGYNVRLAFDEFVQLYRILLPKGMESNRKDVEEFLGSLPLNHHNYQLGSTKIFLREVEKIKLDYILHQQIMASIVAIQRWYRTSLERRHFLHVREAIIRIQAYFRMFLAQKFVQNLRMRHLAATYVQKVWRGYRVRKWYESFRNSCIQFQARVKGSFIRQRYQNILEQQRRLAKQKEKLQNALRGKGDEDSLTSAQSTDEAFLSKGSSQEEIDDHRNLKPPDLGESDESSGVHEDSETEFPSVPPRRGMPKYQPSQFAQSLADSMPALTLALTSTPFVGLQNLTGQRNGKLSASRSSSGSITSGTGSKSSASPIQRQRSVSPSPKKELRDSSQKQPEVPSVKERTKKKLSLKSSRNTELEFGQVEEEDTVGGDDFENIPNKNPFHRAKKHLKTFISGSKTKLEKHEAVLLDSESEADDTDTLTCKSSSSSQNLDRAPSLPSCAATGHKFETDNKSRHSLDFNFKSSATSAAQPSVREINRSVQSPSERKASLNDDRTRRIVQCQEDEEEEDPGFEDRVLPPARFHRKITREDTGAFGVIAKARGMRREARQKLITDAIHAVSSQESRRASDDLLEDADSDVRRGSGDSNKSNPSIGSPTHSSQDSLFDLNRTNGLQSPLILTQSRSYGFAPTTSGSTTSMPLDSTVINKRGQLHYSENNKENSYELGLPTSDFMSSRDIRRTKSVSDSRRGYIDHPLTEVSSEELLESSVNKQSGSTSSEPPGKKSGYHVLDKVTKFHRGDICCGCRKNMHVLFAPGYRCYLCHLFFHTKCVHNGAVYKKLCRVGGEVLGNSAGAFPLPSEENTPDSPNTARSNSGTSGRKKYRKGSKGHVDMSKPGKFNLTGTSEFTDRTDQIISGVKELQLMQDFISKKIYQVRNKEGEKENAVDRVFTQALREFKESLVSTFSVASKSGSGTMLLNIKYKDLIANFANIMETVCKHEGTGDDFPTTMGVNAFRGFLNEFMNAHRIDEKPSKGTSKAIRNNKERRKDSKRNKRSKADDLISHLGHSFVSMVINIPTACEVCSSFIMWPIERGVVCQKCKLACHKKCHLKIMQECIEGHGRSSSSAGNDGIFGASLRSLTGPEAGIPLLVEHLVTAIEFYGLRMEGLYRKSGVSSKVRELKQEIEDKKEISWENYPVHVLTSVLKSYFRELPEPLMTYELYDEFLRAADLSQAEDRVHTIFAILKKLPKVNYDVLERLIFHLVRVALYEDKNRMNANSLAIVFAPCILRTNKNRQVQESLSDISRQTLCIETILAEQLKKVKATLSNIESVDSASHSFSVRLNSIRSSKIRSPPERKKASSGSTGSLSEGSNDKSMNESTTPESMSAEEEEEYLTRHLQHLQDEKAMLTSVLPSLSRTPSDDDMLSTDPEADSPGGSVDDLQLHLHTRRSPSPRKTRAQSLQYSKSDALIVDSFGTSRLSPTLRLPSNSPLLQNLVKHRGPVRKPPSRFVRNLAVVDFGEGEGEEEDSYEIDMEDEDEPEPATTNEQTNDDEEEGIMV